MPATQDKYYRTVITVEVLSDKPLSSELDLADIGYMIDEGDCSGKVTQEPSQEVDERTICQLLQDQASEPTFLAMDVDRKYVKVEYDPNYWGGNYSGVGQDAFLQLLDVYLERDCDLEEAVRRVFEKQIGRDRRNIVHFTVDELYDSDGAPYEE